MKYISILLILLATSSCDYPAMEVAEEPKDTVVIYDYLRGNDTLIIDTVSMSKKKCQKSVDSQMQSLHKMESKLDRLKRKIKERKKKRNKRKGNAYL